MYKISIVIPVCNRLDKLEKTIESISQQTYANFEVIFVENNSKKPSHVVSFIKEQSKKINAEVRVFSLSRCANANVARNYGADNSTGDYIAFLDSDDLWEPEHLEISLNELIRTSSQFIYGGASVFNGTHTVKRAARNVKPGEKPVDYILGFRGGWAQTSSYVLERNAFNIIRWDEGFNRCQDLDFFSRAASKLKSICSPSITVTVVWIKGEQRSYDFVAMNCFYHRYKQVMSISTRFRFVLLAVKICIISKNFDFFRYLIRS